MNASKPSWARSWPISPPAVKASHRFRAPKPAPLLILPLSGTRPISGGRGGDGRRKISGNTINPGLFGRLFIFLAIVPPAVFAATDASARSIEIVAFGDSNTAGDGVGPSHAWPALVEKMLRAKGHDVTIRNAGASGDTTAEGLARFDRAFPKGTDAAIVFLGRNDMRFGAPVARTNANIGTIVKRLRQRDIDVLVIGFKPYDFAKIAAAQGAAYYPDFFEGVSRQGKKLRRYILPLDLFHHLNASGHKIVAGHLFPAVEALAKRAGG